MTRSQNIPVSKDPEEIRIQAAQERIARMVECQQQLFDSRLVDGMKGRQIQSTDRSLQHQNIAPIDRAEFSWYTDLEPRTGKSADEESYMPHGSSDGISVLANALQVIEHNVNDEEELMFDMDL
jgi:hypothetical protein